MTAKQTARTIGRGGIVAAYIPFLFAATVSILAVGFVLYITKGIFPAAWTAYINWFSH